jgi:hypothetical protein
VGGTGNLLPVAEGQEDLNQFKSIVSKAKGIFFDPAGSILPRKL